MAKEPKNTTSDFIIIGGGIAGLSTGARLAPFGSVTVLEAEDQLAYHTSARSAALYEKNYGAPAVCALSRAGETFYQDNKILSPRGFLLLGTTDTTAEFRADCEELNLSEIALQDAHDMVPIISPAVTHAAHGTSAQDMDTDLLIQGFVKTINQHDGQILTSAGATHISRHPAGWDVQTPHITLQAKTLINAAGAWGDQIAEMAGIPPIGLTPLRRSVARIAAPGGHDVTDWPIMFGPGETWYAKPDAGAMIVSPANETPSQPMDAWPEDMELAEGLARYQDHVTVPVTKPIATWAGLRTFAPDRNLVLGRAPQDLNFVWCVGQGGYGFQTAAGASQLLADLIFHSAPSLAPQYVAALSPDRFN